MDPCSNHQFTLHKRCLIQAQSISNTIASPNSNALPAKLQEDRLSNLPDDILLTILEELDDIRDNTRASLLSSLWRRLPGLLSDITIDVCSFCGENVDPDSTPRETLATANTALIRAAKRILPARARSRRAIGMLVMRFFLKDDDRLSSIGRLVGDAMASNGPAVAEFTILTEKDSLRCTDYDFLVYGRRLMSFFRASAGAFGGLTHLQLENLFFVDSSDRRRKRHWHLQEAPVFFRLDNCETEVNPTVLRIEHSQLVELEILYREFRCVELRWLPKLKQFTCTIWRTNAGPVPLGHALALRSWTSVMAPSVGTRS